MARLKSSADLVKAIEAAIRIYEEPPTEAMTVETHWADIWLSADDWADAFDAWEPGTPHNEARDQIWEELLTILVDKHDDDVPADLLRRSLLQNRDLLTAFKPGVAAGRSGRHRRGPVVGTRPSAEVRSLARPRRGAQAAAPGRPGLDGVRPTAPGRGTAATRRPGGVPAQASARRRRRRRTRAHGQGRRRPAQGR